MAALGGTSIRKRMGDAGSTRLVVAPLLEPDAQLRSDRAAIDVRLGSRFHVANASSEAVIDTLLEPERRLPKVPLFVPLGEGIVLHPHQFMLGETLEFIRLPDDLMAYVVGRSSWGRDGLVVATAVGVHPTFAGPIVLELRNLGEVPVRLYPGDPIAQLFIHTVDGARADDRDPPKPSQFAGARAPSPGAHRYPLTAEKLKRLRAKRKTGGG